MLHCALILTRQENGTPLFGTLKELARKKEAQKIVGEEELTSVEGREQGDHRKESRQGELIPRIDI
jgi:hypothetical protein